MSDIKILLLCNNKVALPAFKELFFFNRLSAVIVPAANKDLISDIKDFIGEDELPILSVNKNNVIDTIKNAIKEYKPLSVLMMTFPFIIPESLLNLPPKGFINFHYGKLPQYRGAEPIFTQIIKQENHPALTVHIVSKGVDDGPIILTEPVEYSTEDTYGMLQNKLALAGQKAVATLVKILSFGKYIPSVPQDETQAGYHKKPTAEDLMINWQTMTSEQIKALVNACNPWNKGCATKINNHIIKITEIEMIPDDIIIDKEPGTIIFIDEHNGLQVVCKNNTIIKLTIIYTQEGFISGWKLKKSGITTGQAFVN